MIDRVIERSIDPPIYNHVYLFFIFSGPWGSEHILFSDALHTNIFRGRFSAGQQGNSPFIPYFCVNLLRQFYSFFNLTFRRTGMGKRVTRVLKILFLSFFFFYDLGCGFVLLSWILVFLLCLKLFLVYFFFWVVAFLFHSVLVFSVLKFSSYLFYGVWLCFFLFYSVGVFSWPKIVVPVF